MIFFQFMNGTFYQYLSFFKASGLRISYGFATVTGQTQLIKITAVIIKTCILLNLICSVVDRNIVFKLFVMSVRSHVFKIICGEKLVVFFIIHVIR